VAVSPHWLEYRKRGWAWISSESGTPYALSPDGLKARRKLASEAGDDRPVSPAKRESQAFILAKASR